MSQLMFLLLEDSLLDTELIEAVLAEGGITCELVQVKSGEEFENALKQHSFDMILSDYSLPGFDGIAALEIAQQLCPNIPFIFVTATMGEEVAIETLKSGATDYVLKQRLERLIPSIQRALREAEERRARQYAEAELNRREQEFRALVENSPDIIFRHDKNYRTLYVSPTITQITGFTPEYFIGKTPDENGCSQEVYQPLVDEMGKLITQQKRRFFEYQFESSEGTRFFDVRMVPELSGDGTVETLLSVARDITVIKQAETKLREQKEELEELNRVKDEFLAVLSHELRSPLNAILGWSKILRSRHVDSTTIERALETIERNARLQTQLIEDLLDVSRIIRGKLTLQPQETDLVPAIEAAIDTMRLAAQAKSIDFKFSILDSQLDNVYVNQELNQLELLLESSNYLNNPKSIKPKYIVLGDPSRLQQIVWNLLSNAIKFTPNNGRVEVILERIEETPLMAQITVKDTGMGIRNDFIPYVFDSFRQADGSTTRKYGGLGLGLAIVRHLVELHGGKVFASSDGEAKGATFVVQIPLVIENKEDEIFDTQSSDSTSSTQPSLLEGVRVLVVDDDTDSREFLEFVLIQSGANTATAPSVQVAFDTIQSFQPNILVSDIGMPEEDGYSLIRRVRNLPPDKGGAIPAIALTAYASDQDRQIAIESGFQFHLPKPVAPDDLVDAVIKVLSGK